MSKVSAANWDDLLSTTTVAPRVSSAQRVRSGHAPSRASPTPIRKNKRRCRPSAGVWRL